MSNNNTNLHNVYVNTKTPLFNISRPVSMRGNDDNTPKASTPTSMVYPFGISTKSVAVDSFTISNIQKHQLPINNNNCSKQLLSPTQPMLINFQKSNRTKRS